MAMLPMRGGVWFIPEYVGGQNNSTSSATTYSTLSLPNVELQANTLIIEELYSTYNSQQNLCIYVNGTKVATQLVTTTHTRYELDISSYKNQVIVLRPETTNNQRITCKGIYLK